MLTCKVCFADSKPIPHLDESTFLVMMDHLELLDRHIIALYCIIMTLLTDLSFQPVVASPHTSSIDILTDDMSIPITTISVVKGSSELIEFSLRGFCSLFTSDESFKVVAFFFLMTVCLYELFIPELHVFCVIYP